MPEVGCTTLFTVIMMSSFPIVLDRGTMPGTRAVIILVRDATPDPRSLFPAPGYHRAMTFFATLTSPVGVIGVVSTGTAVTGVGWRMQPASDASETGGAHADPLLGEALAQLRAYFAGRLTEFDLPFDLGPQSASAAAVLAALHETVRFGETVTYGELAARSGSGVPARGIGSIMGANPIPILVPCHRVVAGDGLGGYSGGDPGEGLITKRWLLEHEGALPTALF